MASGIHATDSTSPEVDNTATSSRSDSKANKSVRFRSANEGNRENLGDVPDDGPEKADQVTKDVSYRDSKTKFPQRSSAISVRMDDLELDDETEDDLSDAQEKVGKEFEKDLRKADQEKNKINKQILNSGTTDADTSPALSSPPTPPLPHASKLVDRQTADTVKVKAVARPSSNRTTEPEQKRNTKPDNTDKVCSVDKRRLSEIRPSDEIPCTCEDYEKYPEHIRSESQEKAKDATEKVTKTPGMREPETQSSKQPDVPVQSNEAKDRQEYKLSKKDSSTLGKLWDNLKSATNGLGKKPPSEAQPAATQKPAGFRDTQSMSSVPVGGLPDLVQRFSSASKLADIVKPDVIQKGPTVPIPQHSPHIKVHAKIDMGTGKIEKIVLENTESEETAVKKEPKHEDASVKQEPRFEFLPVEQTSASQIPKVPSGAVQPAEQREETPTEKRAEPQQLMDEPVDDAEWSTENLEDESNERTAEQDTAVPTRSLPNGASTVSEFLMERPITDVMFSRPTVGRKKSQGRASDKRLQAKAAPIPFHKTHESPSDSDSKRKRKRVRFADSDELSESEMSDNLDAASSSLREDEAPDSVGEKIADKAKEWFDSTKSAVASVIPPIKSEEVTDAISNTGDKIVDQAKGLYESAKSTVASVTAPMGPADSKDAPNKNTGDKIVDYEKQSYEQAKDAAAPENSPDGIGKNISDALSSSRGKSATKAKDLHESAKDTVTSVVSPAATGKDIGNSEPVQTDGRRVAVERTADSDTATGFEIVNKLETVKDIIEEKGKNLIDIVKDKAQSTPTPSDIADKLGNVKDAVAEKGTSVFNTVRDAVQGIIPSPDKMKEKLTAEVKENASPQTDEQTSSEKTKQIFENAKTQVLNQAKNLTESAKETITSFLDSGRPRDDNAEPKEDKSEPKGSRDNKTPNLPADVEQAEQMVGFTENMHTKGVGRAIKEAITHAFQSDQSKADERVAASSYDNEELEREPDAQEKYNLSTPLCKGSETEDSSQKEAASFAKQGMASLGKVKDQVVAQVGGVFESAKKAAGAVTGTAQKPTSEPEVDNQEVNEAEAPSETIPSEGEANTEGVQVDSPKQQPTSATVPQKGSFMDLVKSEGIGSAIKSMVTNAFSQSALPVTDSSEAHSKKLSDDGNQPGTIVGDTPRPSERVLSNAEILTEESEDDTPSSTGKEPLPRKDSAELDPPPSPIHATRSLTDLKDDHSCRADQMAKTEEEDSKMSLSNLQQNQPPVQESQGFFASIKNIVVHALEYHPPPRRHSGTDIAHPDAASSAEECAEYCIRHSGEFVIADPTHDDHSRAEHRIPQVQSRTGEADQVKNHTGDDSQTGHGVMSNVYGTVKEMLSYIFVAEHEEPSPAAEPPDTSTSTTTESDMNHTKSNNPPVKISNPDTDEASENEGAAARIKARGIELRRTLIDQTECAAGHNEAVWRTRAQFERILSRKHNSDNEGRKLASDQTSSIKENQRAEIDEGILRTRRARRKMPTSSIETDTFSMPYSFNQQGPPLNIDPNDDSESDAHTLPDHMFRPPAAVRYSAYIIGACMVSMVFLALQYRFTDTVLLRPEIWIPRLAFVVLLTLGCGLVYGYLTKPDFVRKASSGTRIDNNETKTEID